MNVDKGYVDAPVDPNLDLKKEIARLKKEKNAVVMAHYYQKGEIQDVADYIGDSLALARIASQIDADIIVLCGVHFMGETAKILCPYKKVIVPDLNAGCSLADSCDAEEFEKFIAGIMQFNHGFLMWVTITVAGFTRDNRIFRVNQTQKIITAGTAAAMMTNF